MAKNYTTGLIITGDASGGIRAIRATDDQLGKLNKSFDRGGRRTRNYRRGVDEASSSLDQLRSVAGPVAAAIAALGAGSFARGMIEEAQQLETNLLRTQQLIDTTGRTATRSAEQMHEQARALALSTLQSTEGVMAAQQTLLTFRNITGDTFDQAIEGAIDLSSAMGQDLNSSVLQLGKALEDPVKGLSALSRSGTVFTDAQRDMVKEMVETNRTAEAQAFILGELAAQYGGVAATEAQGLVGAQDTFGQKVQEAKIELADQLNAVERSTELYKTASKALQSLTNNMDTAVSVGGGLAALLAGRLAGSLATVTARMMAATTAAGTLRGALTLLGGPIGLLVGAGGLLYMFRDELGLSGIALNDVGKNAAKTDIALHNLSAAVDDSAEAALDANYQELTSQLFEVGRTAAAARVELAELEAEQNSGRSEQSNSRGRRAIGPNEPEQGLVDAARIQRAKKALEEYEAQEERLLQGIERNDTEREAAAAARAERDKVRAAGIKRASDLLDDNSSSSDKNTEATGGNAKAASKQADAYKTLVDKLYPLQAAQRQFREEMGLLDTAKAAGAIHNLADAQQRLRESYQSDQNFQDAYGFTGQGGGDGENEQDYWSQWLEGAEVAMSSFDNLAGSTIENFSQRFGSAFESMIFDAQSLGDAVHGMAEGMARSVVSSLGEMAAQWLAYQAVQMLVGETGQSMAGKEMAKNAAATSLQAGIAAYASTAAIPVIGPIMAPAAMKTAIGATAPIAAGIAAMGMAHEGIDRIPKEGTWLLDKGERVMNRPQADRLDQYLAQQQTQPQRREASAAPGVVVNLVESQQRAGEVESRRGGNGEMETTAFVADIRGRGQRAKVLEQTYNLKRQGR